MQSIQKLLEVMGRLRDPDQGCPWDLEQDFASIAPYTIEEAYEVADAIAREDWVELRDELGDLLFQVVFYARMAAEAGYFDFEDVAAAISEKMVRRHPHVFGDAEQRAAGPQPGSWASIKAEERSSHGDRSALAGVARALPALKRAEKLGKRAGHVGFDWPDRHGVDTKIREELDELEDAVASGDSAETESEFGDLLFSIVNLARHLGVDPEHALNGANVKFERRFRDMEAALEAQGASLRALSLDELEAAWQSAKRRVG
ncbi:MAG TPA: nucleoside triphosphate pyrophosphohydrolase [Woeseiaceae bacterium]|jgi:ATP diphosphatase|nr:nucleoside triphosphate pyrophosphohydrolase [Woeseiaceae bacterium]